MRHHSPARLSRSLSVSGTPRVLPVVLLALSLGLASAVRGAAPADAASASAVVSQSLVQSSAAQTQYQYLSGHGPEDAVLWDFVCTAGRRVGEAAKINVPSCWEQEGFGTYNYGMTVRDKPDDFPGLAREQGRYHTRFSVPSAWKGRDVRIVFEGVMTDAEVRVNGQLVGPVHQGAFYRFRHDLSQVLHYGADNDLEVLVSKESANRSVNEAERRGDYWNFGGIFRPVYLEALPSFHIERLAVDARADGTLNCDVFTGGATLPGASLNAELLDSSGRLVASIPATAVSATESSRRLSLKVPGISLWSAETPTLYTLRVTLSGKDGIQHTTTDRFGFRTFEIRRGDGLYLNGQRILLKGVNRHAFRPATARTLSRADDLADVLQIKGMNMNAVRMSHYPPDKSFLEACDERGLYVLDELGGWHGLYDTPTGRGLVREMVTRDVNHPSILFWDNGNEMGWNAENDGEFARWDPQARPVLHPLGVFNGVNTFHYRSYAETESYLAGPDIFMPTEFLHGLYDGGHGAGLNDYWELMRTSPRSGGGFLWVYADEGVARSDQDGRIDNAGSFAPDGIVGPNLEHEGSYETIREVWSPIHLGPDSLPADFKGSLSVENRYDFVPLDRCTFRWSLVRFASTDDKVSGHSVLSSGELRGPSLPPHAAGSLDLPLPANWRSADALLVTAVDPQGASLWTRSWNWAPIGFPSHSSAASVSARDDGVQFAASVGNLDVRWDKDSGNLATILVNGRPISLHKGPRLLAAHRSDRNLDGTPVVPAVAKNVDRQYTAAPSASSKFLSITQRQEGPSVIIDVTYEGALRRATWRLEPDGSLYLDYEYSFDGVVDLLGLVFDYPESRMRSVRWLGMGPFRVWQNRLHGTTLDTWSNTYNDSVPGSTYATPEFKGYFNGWHWASFTTSEGRFSISNRSPGSFLGVYSPKDGATAPNLCVLPEHGIGIFDVIPAMRNKVNATELIGPSSQPQKVSGIHRGSVVFRFDAE